MAEKRLIDKNTLNNALFEGCKQCNREQRIDCIIKISIPDTCPIWNSLERVKEDKPKTMICPRAKNGECVGFYGNTKCRASQPHTYNVNCCEAPVCVRFNSVVTCPKCVEVEG